MFPWIPIRQRQKAVFRHVGKKEPNNPEEPGHLGKHSLSSFDFKMFKIPILSRLSFHDYASLMVALGILIIERIIRVCMFFVPYSLLDHFRYKIIG